LDGHKEKRLAALKEPSISSAMLIRIIDVDGASPSKKLMNDMSMRDRSALRQEMLTGGRGNRHDRGDRLPIVRDAHPHPAGG